MGMIFKHSTEAQPPEPREVEEEFWKLVIERDSHVVVHQVLKSFLSHFINSFYAFVYLVFINLPTTVFLNCTFYSLPLRAPSTQVWTRVSGSQPRGRPVAADTRGT